MPIVLYYLTVVLPCLQRTLRDVMIYADNQLPPVTKWILLNERLSEQGGMAVGSRFVMYDISLYI